MKRIINNFKSKDKKLVVLNGEVHELTQEAAEKILSAQIAAKIIKNC